MGIERMIEILSKLGFGYRIKNKCIAFERSDYTVTLDLIEMGGVKYWTYSIINFKDGVPNIMHLDTLFNKIDVKLILYPILEIFKYEIREQKIDLILESDI